MNETPQLIGHINKKYTEQGLKFIPVMILIFFFGLGMLSLNNPLPPLSWSTYIIKIFLYIGIAVFSFLGLFIFFFIQQKKPIIVLDERGIWLRYYNFIPWENIKEFNIYTPRGLPTECIGINVHNLDLVSRNANRSGKIGLVWAKYYKNYPHITVSGFDIPNEELMLFFHRHVSTQHPDILYTLITPHQNTQEIITATKPVAPQRFSFKSLFVILFVSAILVYMKESHGNYHEGFSISFGICAGILIGNLINQYWGPHAQFFKEKKLYTFTEFSLWAAVVAGIFIVDKITTNTYHYSTIINYFLCLVIFCELIRREYRKQ